MELNFNDGLFLEDYKLPSPLTSNEIEELFLKYKNGDLKAKEKLINHNLKLVFYRVLKKFNNTEIDCSDLVCIGNIGLIKAVETFDIDKKSTFANYAIRCIDNEILMHFRYVKKHNVVQSLNTVISVDQDDNEETLEQTIASNDDFEEEIIENEQQKIVREIIEELPEREKQILYMYFGFNDDKQFTQQEIADEFGLTRSYICKIINTALKKIKCKMENNVPIVNAKVNEEELWNIHYKHAKEHFFEKGNLNISKKDVFTINNRTYNLKCWLDEQIKLYNNNKLGIERIILLTELNISWDINKPIIKRDFEMKTWLINYEISKSYYINNKNLLIPTEYTVAINNNVYDIGLWLKEQRTNYKNNELTQEQISLLNQIEMIWNKKKYQELMQQQKWLEKYELLKEYFEENNNSFPLQGYIVENEFGIHKLGNWFSNQKQEFKKGILKKERLELLNNLDKNWYKLLSRNDKKSWDFYYGLAKEFYKEKGHLFIPNNYSVEKEGKRYNLGIWIKSQRQAYLETSNATITKHQTNLLNEIEMIWVVHDYLESSADSNWIKHYNLTREYYNKNGNVDFNTDYTVAVNNEKINVGIWLEKQKEIYNGIINGNLTSIQIKLLNQVKVDWYDLKPIIKKEKIPAKWLENYELAKEYYLEYGHLVIPRTYSAKKNDKKYNVGKWLETQQRVYLEKKPGNINAQQIAMLEEIKMIWDKNSKEYMFSKQETITEKWLENYKYAKAYYNERDNLLIPHNFVVIDNNKVINLGIWLYTQRQCYKENKLSKNKIKFLEDIGMIWDIKEYKRITNYKDVDCEDLKKEKYNVENDEVYLQLYQLSLFPMFENALMYINENIALILLLKLKYPKKDINEICAYVGINSEELKGIIKNAVFELKEKIEQLEFDSFIDDYNYDYDYDYAFTKENV